MFLPRARSAIVAGALVTFTLTSTASASPLELFGFGARSSGMVGTGVASTTGYESVYLNPAGLARVPRKRATVGAMLGDFDLEIDGRDTGTDWARGVLIGGELPIPLGGSMKNRLGLGFGFHIPGRAIARVRQPFPGTPDFSILENRSHVIALQIATGVKINDRLDLGIGVITLAELAGGIAVSTDSAGRFATTSEQKLLTKFAPVIGGRWQHSDTLAFGGVLRWESRSDYSIAVTTAIADVVPIQLPAINIAGTAQFDPISFSAEAAWTARPGLLVTGHLQWQHWSRFPLPTRNPVSGSPPQDAPGFHDTVVPRVAVELTRRRGAIELTGRAGAAFVMSPAPEASGRQSFLDNHRVVTSLGGGFALPGSSLPLHVDVWGQVHQLIPRRHAKDADAFDPDETLPFEVIDTGGRVVVGGVTVGVDL